MSKFFAAPSVSAALAQNRLPEANALAREAEESARAHLSESSPMRKLASTNFQEINEQIGRRKAGEATPP